MQVHGEAFEAHIFGERLGVGTGFDEQSILLEDRAEIRKKKDLTRARTWGMTGGGRWLW
jgi:hypothetical protein